MSGEATDQDLLIRTWDELGIRWTDDSEDAEDQRSIYGLPASLKIGAVLSIGLTQYFFDAAGKYIGYGSMDAQEMIYFIERGRERESPADDDSEDVLHRIKLEGNYAWRSPNTRILTQKLSDLPIEQQRFVSDES